MERSPWPWKAANQEALMAQEEVFYEDTPAVAKLDFSKLQNPEQFKQIPSDDSLFDSQLIKNYTKSICYFVVNKDYVTSLSQ